MRIVFEDGSIIDCKDVNKIILDSTDGEVKAESPFNYILKDEYNRGYKDGYKAGVVDRETKNSSSEELIRRNDETLA